MKKGTQESTEESGHGGPMPAAHRNTCSFQSNPSLLPEGGNKPQFERDRTFFSRDSFSHNHHQLVLLVVRSKKRFLMDRWKMLGVKGTTEKEWVFKIVLKEQNMCSRFGDIRTTSPPLATLSNFILTSQLQRHVWGQLTNTLFSKKRKHFWLSTWQILGRKLTELGEKSFAVKHIIR